MSQGETGYIRRETGDKTRYRRQLNIYSPVIKSHEGAVARTKKKSGERPALIKKRSQEGFFQVDPNNMKETEFLEKN